MSLRITLFYLIAILLSYSASGNDNDPISYLQMDEVPIKIANILERKRSDPKKQHELVFAIQHKESALRKLDNVLRELSSPLNPKYQKWLTFDEVGEITSNGEGFDAVLNWIQHANDDISDSNEQFIISWKSRHCDFIKVSAPISRWEKLLRTEFFEHEDLSSKKNNIFHRSKHYSVPAAIQPHLHAIFNTVQMPPKIFDSMINIQDSNKATQLRPLTNARNKSDPVSSGQSNIGGAVTVALLNKVYNIPGNKGSSSLTQVVFATNKNYFAPGDLTTFQNKNGFTKQAALNIGGFATAQCDSNPPVSCGEGNLDIQYLMGVAQNSPSIYWYSSNTETDPFVSWITSMADMNPPPQSSSISYGAQESTVSTTVLKSFNTQAMKLAAMGATIVVATGNDGASTSTGDSCQCGADSSSKGSSWYSSGGGGAGTKSGWTGQGYFPYFPASCPYVTAVGATMGPENGNTEVACQSQQGGVITSGGGFSTFFAQPAWQQVAVSAYLKAANSSALTAPAAGFNPRGRAYPDVALLGVNYQVIISGSPVGIYGTSASAPVFAAMITLINSARQAAGLPNVGFINPTLYAASAKLNRSQVFHDVTSGHNKCCSTSAKSTCCKSGFTAIRGWDPVTGWGSVNLNQLAGVFNVTIPQGQATTNTAARNGLPLLYPSLLMGLSLVIIAWT